MYIPLQPSSPSAKQSKHSPTSPSYPEHYFKKTLLDEVKTWSETRVTEWLVSQSLGRFSQKFIEHNISGAVLLDLDYEAFKAMDFKTVGERVRLMTAVKALRQECYLAASLAARTPIRIPNTIDRHDTHSIAETIPASIAVTTPSITKTSIHSAYSKLSKSSETSSARSLLNRSNSFSRFLGRSDSKRSQKVHHHTQPHNNTSLSNVSTMTGSNQSQYQNQDLYSQLPSSPKSTQKRNSLEGGIMSMEKVKQTCVKVFGEDGETRIVNVQQANESKQIMAKVLHKFGIEESSADSYCIFVGSSTNGEARALSDTELVEICRSTDRPEKERLILRKRHLYPTHEQFKRKGTVNIRQLQHEDHPSPIYHANHTTHWRSKTESPVPFYLPTRASSFRSNHSLSSTNSSERGGRRRFFGERPPSEIISSNLHSFFPNHNREVLETAGMNVQRLSMTRRNSSLTRLEPRNYRNSVLPELVSVLGVDLDKFLEEEEVQDIIEEEDGSDSSSLKDEPSENQILKQLKPDEELKSLKEDYSKLIEPLQLTNHTIDLNFNKMENETAHSHTEIVTTPTLVSRHNILPDSWMKGSLIGRGTLGDVYFGLNSTSGELMAIKQIELLVANSASDEHQDSMVNALRGEIDSLRDLQHENIVQYLGFQADDSYFCIFLEYVAGGSVAGLLSSYGAFQETLVKSFVRQILKGLSYLHSKGIVHRDIKGANVLVDNKGGVKITDFGISKKVKEDISLRRQSAANRSGLQSSVYWMAPEVVKQAHYTKQADIWSLGCLMVEMFTGDHPFPGYSQMQAIFKIGNYTAPDIPLNLSEDAQDFLKCTFRINYEERPSADELLKHPFLAEDDSETSSLSL